MTSEQMSVAVAEFLDEANVLQWRKNKDYHPDNVAFLEILRTAYETGISVEQDLWAKIRKQYIALRSFVIEGKTESEPPRSRMMDIAVYMGMLACWIQFNEQIINDALVFIRDQTACEKINTEVDSSCINRGLRKDERCERCGFLAWLMYRAH